MGDIPVIDIVFFALVVLMAIHGFLKGFVEALFSWAAPVLAILAAVFMYPHGGAFIRSHTMEDVRIVPEFLAFLAIFLIVLLFIKFLGRVLRDVILGIHLGGVNRLFGFVFGIAQGIAIVAIILFFFMIQPVFDTTEILKGSIFAEFLYPFIQIPLERGRGADIINV